MWFVTGLAVGVIIGYGAALFMQRRNDGTAKELAEEIFRENEQLRNAEKEALIEGVKSRFGDISKEALDHFFHVAKEKFESERQLQSNVLDTKKTQIDENIGRMTTELEKVTALVNSFEKDREQKFGHLSKHLEETTRQRAELINVTNKLSEALSGTKTRGQWGERMAEDVLRIAGFIEDVNYRKQKAIEGVGSIPDFTFLMPRNLTLNMDVKFPYSNYVRYLETDSDIEKESFLKEFLRDVKKHIGKVADSDYINIEQNTVDYVLMFIPNEQIYTFIHEMDNTVLDYGLQKKVIICSPITLFAVLSVIRASIENFALEQKSKRMLMLFGTFKKQWEKFKKSMRLVEKRLNSVQTEYGNLMTTRTNTIEKPLNELYMLGEQKGLHIESDDSVQIELPDSEDSDYAGDLDAEVSEDSGDMDES